MRALARRANRALFAPPARLTFGALCRTRVRRIPIFFSQLNVIAEPLIEYAMSRNESKDPRCENESFSYLIFFSTRLNLLCMK
jgi:hypothetical protein